MPLPPNDKKLFRNELAVYCKLAEQYESRWHYTQRRPYSGLGAAPQTYHYNDCSSYVALAFYWAMKHTQVRVGDPLGWKFSGWGNTETAIAYLDAHKAPSDKYRIGDVAIYGTPGNLSTQHMTVCRKAGTKATSVWSSFGQEAGPEKRPLVTGKRIIGVYRHPALL